jgi:PD-(D/E)XK endonuclease
VNTSLKGDRTEAVVLSVLAKAGYTILVPFGVARYDLAVDDGTGEGIKTIQCKTGRIRQGCVAWNACSQNRDTKERRDYRGQVDYFGVWSPDNDKVYLVPVGDVAVSEGRLRLDAAKNNQKFGVRLAADYEVHGALAQFLVERVHGMHEVAGSSPAGSTWVVPSTYARA